jgi:hypothetical protein
MVQSLPNGRSRIAAGGRLHIAAHFVSNQLQTVQMPRTGTLPLPDRSNDTRRRVVVNRGGPAGKNQAFGPARTHFVEHGIEGQNPQ